MAVATVVLKAAAMAVVWMAVADSATVAVDSVAVLPVAACSASGQTTEQRAKTKWLGVAMAAAATKSSLYRSCRRLGSMARVEAEATALQIASQNHARSPDSHRPSV